MRVRTVILAVAALAVIALAGGAWRLYASRDALIKRAIEHFGPELTGVTVTVKRVKLEPVEGRGAISGLEIGNTRGFSGAKPRRDAPRRSRRTPRRWHVTDREPRAA